MIFRMGREKKRRFCGLWIRWDGKEIMLETCAYLKLFLFGMIFIVMEILIDNLDYIIDKII